MRITLLCILCSALGYSQPSVEQAQQYIENKEFQKAERLLAPYVEEDYSNLKAIEVLGDTYGHQKKWDEAIVQYKKLRDANPKNANYHYKYGGALGMKALQISKLRAIGLIGDLKRAFETAAQLDPNHIDARWALVELYMTLPGIVGGSKDKSLKYADELEALSKVDGYLAKGYVYEYDDQPELAEQYYLKAIKIGGSVTCYEKLTKLYETQNKPHKAIDNIEQAQQKHQRNALHYQIGKVSADYNVQLEKGEKCLKSYISNYSSADGVPKEWAYYRLAQIHKHKKDKTQALHYINKALSIRSEFKEALAEKLRIEKM